MWKNRRRIVALLGGATILLLPFLRIRGRSAARFDLSTLSLHLFGAVVPIDEFYLVLLGALFLVSLALSLSVEGPARLLDDPEVAVPSRGRVAGKMTVRGGDGAPGEILITAAGRGFRIVRKAAFP